MKLNPLQATEPLWERALRAMLHSRLKPLTRKLALPSRAREGSNRVRS